MAFAKRNVACIGSGPFCPSTHKRGVPPVLPASMSLPQMRSRATAMKLLLSRIYAQRIDAQKKEMERFYGEKGSVSWGNQIRSYVFQPYRMVKDLRTGVEMSDVQAVMDGDLDAFVNGWLRAGCPMKRM